MLFSLGQVLCFMFVRFVVADFGLAGVEFVVRLLVATSCSRLVIAILPSIKVWYASTYSGQKDIFCKF